MTNKTIEYVQNLIDLTLTTFEKIYIHCVVTEELKVGSRPFTESEMVHGIFFLISARSCRKFKMEDDYIYAELRFSGVWENVYIPYKSIISILDNIDSPVTITNFLNVDEVKSMKNEKGASAVKKTSNKNKQSNNIEPLKTEKATVTAKTKLSKEELKNKIIKPDFLNKK